jgi:hypothetical protein
VHAERREKVNCSGMEKVLAFEESQGRHPTDLNELQQNHAGYDVESKDDQGLVERYIEVKSLSGDWDGPHVEMSAPQFEKNQEIGNRYWLYVVERADQPEGRIWRIQNPAERVTSFMYDDGWKAVAEPDADCAMGTSDE